VLSATLDSNTYISALNFGGAPLQVLNLARPGFIRLDVSDAILEEFAGVLRHSMRSVCMGSLEAARRAGHHAAMRPVSSNRHPMAVNVNGS
jgi:hypothetical protein